MCENLTEGACGGDFMAHESLKSLVNQFTELGMWSAALFWADKAHALSGMSGEHYTACTVAAGMLRRGEFHRAAYTLTSRGLHKVHLMSYYVAARALIEAKEYKDTLQLLEEVDPESLMHNNNEPPRNRILGAVAVIKGRALSAMERRSGAGNSFLQALHKDVYCYEALDFITRHHMLTPQEEIELLNSLPFEEQCSKSEIPLIKMLYYNELNKYGSGEKDSKLSLKNLSESCDETVRRLAECSSDAIEGRARQLLRKGEFETCLRVLGPAEGDSERACELRTACLAELKRPPALFSLAHRLVDKYPQSAISWFAVGCYYYIIGKSEFARRYLSKATTLDRGMGSAWLAYGHSFAADNEHDQAMAAYFKASQLMSGCHLPLLYIGLECGLTNNSKMADKFFQQALLLAPNDPHVLHEMGVIAFQNQQYEEAERLWRLALSEVNSVSKSNILNERWQPLLNNLGHACRKNKKHSESIAFHEQALTIIPGCGATYSALGFCLALVGEIERAMDAFHSALSKKPDDTFSATMLTYLVDQLAEQAVIDDDIPEFQFPRTSFNLPTASKARTEQNKDNKSDYNLTCNSDMSMSFDD